MQLTTGSMHLPFRSFRLSMRSHIIFDFLTSLTQHQPSTTMAAFVAQRAAKGSPINLDTALLCPSVGLEMEEDRLQQQTANATSSSGQLLAGELDGMLSQLQTAVITIQDRDACKSNTSTSTVDVQLEDSVNKSLPFRHIQSLAQALHADPGLRSHVVDEHDMLYTDVPMWLSLPKWLPGVHWSVCMVNTIEKSTFRHFFTEDQGWESQLYPGSALVSNGTSRAFYSDIPRLVDRYGRVMGNVEANKPLIRVFRCAPRPDLKRGVEAVLAEPKEDNVFDIWIRHCDMGSGDLSIGTFRHKVDDDVSLLDILTDVEMVKNKRNGDDRSQYIGTTAAPIVAPPEPTIPVSSNSSSKTGKGVIANVSPDSVLAFPNDSVSARPFQVDPTINSMTDGVQEARDGFTHGAVPDKVVIIHQPTNNPQTTHRIQSAAHSTMLWVSPDAAQPKDKPALAEDIIYELASIFGGVDQRKESATRHDIATRDKSVRESLLTNIAVHNTSSEETQSEACSIFSGETPRRPRNILKDLEEE